MNSSVHLAFCLLASLILACDRPSPPSPQMSNYDLIPSETEGLLIGELRNIDKEVIEQGYFLNGQKHGTWVKYSPNGTKVEEMSGFINGKLEGITIKLNENDQLSERAFYRNNELHGLYQKFEHGKLKMEANYHQGVLNGRVTKYINFSRKKLSEADYKNGQLHGVFRHFDDEGNVTLEYQYANGEKVSGGAK